MDDLSAVFPLSFDCKEELERLTEMFVSMDPCMIVGWMKGRTDTAQNGKMTSAV